jgi:hypothetical protein
MKFILTYKKFEDVANATTSGMGAVTSSQPSSNAGSTIGGVDGSGDITFTLKRKKRKKGTASEVSDLRDLENNLPITKIKE